MNSVYNNFFNHTSKYFLVFIYLFFKFFLSRDSEDSSTFNYVDQGFFLSTHQEKCLFTEISILEDTEQNKKR
jgi:hypothetical protein